MLSTSFTQREKSLSEMLEFSANTNQNQTTSTALSTSTTTTTTTTSITNSTTTNLNINSHRSLEYYFKKFVTLFLALQESGKGEAPIVVLILGELTGLISSETKQHLSEFLMKQCNEKLWR